MFALEKMRGKTLKLTDTVHLIQVSQYFVVNYVSVSHDPLRLLQDDYSVLIFAKANGFRFGFKVQACCECAISSASKSCGGSQMYQVRTHTVYRDAFRWLDMGFKGTGSRFQRMLINQNAVFLPEHAVSSMQAI